MEVTFPLAFIHDGCGSVWTVQNVKRVRGPYNARWIVYPGFWHLCAGVCEEGGSGRGGGVGVGGRTLDFGCGPYIVYALR